MEGTERPWDQRHLVKQSIGPTGERRFKGAVELVVQP
jgi:hypothetical protein